MNTSAQSQLTLKFSAACRFFKGTRVAVKTLFEYLENDYSLEEFLECTSVTLNLSARPGNALHTRYFLPPPYEILLDEGVTSPMQVMNRW